MKKKPKNKKRWTQHNQSQKAKKEFPGKSFLHW